ncbi:MAG: large-conductance mechanosensitive channel protein MscL [Bacteroidia bacterium]
MLKEFKDFAMRGNLVDMAIGIVIGAAFATVTTAFINGIFMPLVGLIFQTGDFNDVTITLGTTADGKPNLIMIGAFVGAVINFLIIAFVMFMLIKGMNALKKKEVAAPAAPPAPTKEEVLLTEIRDALVNRKN